LVVKQACPVTGPHAFAELYEAEWTVELLDMIPAEVAAVAGRPPIAGSGCQSLSARSPEHPESTASSAATENVATERAARVLLERIGISLFGWYRFRRRTTR
jgi:hypothetical protein